MKPWLNKTNGTTKLFASMIGKCSRSYGTCLWDKPFFERILLYKNHKAQNYAQTQILIFEKKPKMCPKSYSLFFAKLFLKLRITREYLRVILAEFLRIARLRFEFWVLNSKISPSGFWILQEEEGLIANIKLFPYGFWIFYEERLVVTNKFFRLILQTFVRRI